MQWMLCMAVVKLPWIRCLHANIEDRAACCAYDEGTFSIMHAGLAVLKRSYSGDFECTRESKSLFMRHMTDLAYMTH